MKPAKPSTTPKSGYVEAKTAASSMKKKRSKEEQTLQNINKAKNELADIIASGGAGTVGSEAGKKPQTRFDAEVDRVRRIVSVNNTDFNAEAANKLLIRTVLAASLDLIPIAEKAYREHKKDTTMYAYLAAITKSLELASDLRMMGDVETQSTFISKNIIHPNFIAQTQNMMQELMSLKTMVDTYAGSSKRAMKINTRIDMILYSVGKFLDDSEKQINHNIERYLSGDLSFTQSGESAGGRKKRKAKGK